MSTQSMIQTLTKQVEQNFHGQAREQILQALEANPTADTVAQIVYDTIMAIDTQAAQRGTPLELDVILPVATEAIDLLVEIMEAMGIEMVADEVREEALMKIAMLHMQAVEGDPEQKAAAEEMLAAMGEAGMVDQASKHIASKAGMNEQQMQAAGAQMGAPQQRPVAAGVRQGLMGGTA